MVYAVHDLPDLPHHWLREVEKFFQSYKALEGVRTDVLGWSGVRSAWAIIAERRARVVAAKHAKL